MHMFFSKQDPTDDAALLEAFKAGCRRVDVISDTHGHLSPALCRQLEGADLIVHAGDITSESDYFELLSMAPKVKAVLGNNDFAYRYGSEVSARALFRFEGVRFGVAHYEEELPAEGIDVGVCGHTHRAEIVRRDGRLLVNPGSASYPRGMRGPTLARLAVRDGEVVCAGLIDLE